MDTSFSELVITDSDYPLCELSGLAEVSGPGLVKRWA